MLCAPCPTQPPGPTAANQPPTHRNNTTATVPRTMSLAPQSIFVTSSTWADQSELFQRRLRQAGGRPISAEYELLWHFAASGRKSRCDTAYKEEFCAGSSESTQQGLLAFSVQRGSLQARPPVQEVTEIRIFH